MITKKSLWILRLMRLIRRRLRPRYTRVDQWNTIYGNPSWAEMTIRHDGTAYSISIHNGVPPVPTIGELVQDGFIRVSCTVSPCEITDTQNSLKEMIYPWVMVQEYRKIA